MFGRPRRGSDTRIKDLLHTINLEWLENYIERYSKLSSRDDFIKINEKIMERRIYWLVNVKQYILTKQNRRKIQKK